MKLFILCCIIFLGIGDVSAVLSIAALLGIIKWKQAIP